MEIMNSTFAMYEFNLTPTLEGGRTWWAVQGTKARQGIFRSIARTRPTFGGWCGEGPHWTRSEEWKKGFFLRRGEEGPICSSSVIQRDMGWETLEDQWSREYPCQQTSGPPLGRRGSS